MCIDKKILISAIVALLTNTISLTAGLWLGAARTAEDLDKFVLPLLSMLGGWVSGIGSLAAVGVALYIAGIQIRDARVQDAVRCIHHAMALINDLKSRVKYLQRTLVEGGRPIAALTQNMDAISRRYEALYDRDLYRHLPGSLVEKITGMSGSFSGIDALVTGIASAFKNEQHAYLPSNRNPTETQDKAFEQLIKDLDDLFTGLQVERSKLQ